MPWGARAKPEEPPAKKPLDEQAGAAEDKAALAITKLGGTATRDEKAAGKPVVAVSFGDAPARAALGSNMRSSFPLALLLVEAVEHRMEDWGEKDAHGQD